MVCSLPCWQQVLDPTLSAYCCISQYFWLLGSDNWMLIALKHDTDFFSTFFFSLLTLFMVSSVIIVVQSLNHVRLFATPWTAACQASLSFTNSRSLLKLMYIESVMLSNHLVLCCPFLLLPSIFPSIKVFSNESAFCIREPNY